MIITLLKNMFLYVNCFTIFNKAVHVNNRHPTTKVFSNIVCAFILSIVTMICKGHFQIGAYIVPYIIYFIILKFITSLPPLGLLSLSLFSYLLSLILLCVSTILIGFVSYPIYHLETECFINVLTFLSCCFATALLHALLKIPRFKNIYQTINTTSVSEIIVLLSLFLLAIFTSDQLNNEEISSLQIVWMTSSVIIILIYDIFIRSQITKSYREKLRLLEVESLRTSQQEQANYISQLEKENERMGRIIHKDNRIVNAMADSVSEYLKDTSLSATERHNKGVALAEQIEIIRTDRQNILLSEEHIHPNPIAQTGYVGVDALIAYMAKEASQHHITLQFDFREDFFEKGNLCMSEADLVHILSDTLKNAIIATRHNNGKIIKLSMLKLKGIPTIAISDSGIPFTIDTYMNFGLEKSSTHMDEGGSGIGLLDIWSLKEKYKATLYIDEQPTTDTYTKQLVFIFDKKNRYMISSNRYKEIQHQQSRADLYVVNPAVERSL